jgi:hypothetical protein
MSEKTLDNTCAKQAATAAPDIKFFGDGDTWRLISKASSKQEGWMKSTKALEVPRLGVLVQVSTQQGDHVAEALAFIPQAMLVGVGDKVRIVKN